MTQAAQLQAERKTGGEAGQGASQPYEIRGDSDSVEIWLDGWLPFEPVGEMLLARDRLQKALRQLDSPASGFILSATYCSPHDSRGDVENVLFYNVGSGAFARVANRGLKFERIHRMPAAAPSGRSFAHHHRYSFVAAPQRPTGKPAASFDFELDGISSSSKAYEVWWAASGISASSSARITGKFELHVELACPRSLKAASIVKPLLVGSRSVTVPRSADEELFVARVSVRDAQEQFCD